MSGLTHPIKPKPQRTQGTRRNFLLFCEGKPVLIGQEFFGAGDEGITCDEVPQRKMNGLGDSNASGGDGFWRLEAVVGEVEIGLRACEVFAIVALAGDGEGFGEASGARSEETRSGAGIEIAIASHGGEAGERLESAEENAASDAVGQAGDIEAIVVAVDEVNVSDARRTEEDGVAESASGSGVGGEIVSAEVGFDLDDACGEALAAFATDEDFAEKFGAHDTGIAVEEGTRQRAHGSNRSLKG